MFLMPNLELMGSTSPGEHHILKCSSSPSLFLCSICYWWIAPWFTQKFKSTSYIWFSLAYSLCLHHSLSHHEPASLKLLLFFSFSSFFSSSHIMLLLALIMSHPVKCNSLSPLRQVFRIYLTHCNRLYGTKVKLYAFLKERSVAQYTISYHGN